MRRCNIDDLENTLRLQTVNNFKVCSIVPGNCATKLARFIEAETNARRDVCKIRKTIHSAVEVCPDRLDLGDKRGCIRPRVLNAISFAENVRTP